VINGVTVTDFLVASLMQQLLMFPSQWQISFLQSAPAALESLKVIAIICRSALWQGKFPPYGSSHTLPPIIKTAVNATTAQILSSSPKPLTPTNAAYSGVRPPPENRQKVISFPMFVWR
jgi:hypothetical protein